MATTTRRTNRTATPERWQAALGRALAEGVQVRQLAGSGQWVATSGRDAGAAYALAVTGGVAHGCDCLAGLNGDPVCKHRATYYAAAGLLDPEPPTPAAPVAPAQNCPDCLGHGHEDVLDAAGAWHRFGCAACRGTGVAAPCDAEEPAISDAETARHDAPYDCDPLPLRRPTLAVAADSAPDPSCRSCFGEGWEPMSTGGRLSDWWPMPCRCRRGEEGPAPLAA